MESRTPARVTATAPPELSMPIGEAMFTQRALRRLQPSPVPAEHLRIIFEAAGKAPSGGNNQRYRILCVTDPERIRRYGRLYCESWWKKRRDLEGWEGPHDVPEAERKRYAPAMRLAEDMATVPCIAFMLSLPPYFPESVLPAAQNLMLAARALGIGSVPTRLHEEFHDDFRALFEVPGDVSLLLAIPLGYPESDFGPTRRLPTTELCSFERWGGPAPWADPGG